MEQQNYESLEDALAHVVFGLGGAKTVAAAMRPELSADAAGRWLKDCLNPDRRETLHPGQLMYILRAGHDAGHHHAIQWMMAELGYARPDPITSGDEQAELLRQLIAATHAIQHIMPRLEHLTEVTNKQSLRIAK